MKKLKKEFFEVKDIQDRVSIDSGRYWKKKKSPEGYITVFVLNIQPRFRSLVIFGLEAQ